MVNDPIFICGFPKTGSSLITQLFNNLPDVMIDMELHCAPDFLRMMHYTMNSGEMKTTINDPDPLAPRMIEWAANDFEKYIDWCRPVFGSIHSGWHKGLRWGNNCKQTIDLVPTLRKLLPKAVVINMLRDPRDCWASLKHSNWVGLEYMTDLNIFLNRYRKIYDFGKRFTEECGVVNLRYEDLVTDPQMAFDLIGETFKPSYIEGTGEIFRYRTLPLQAKNKFDDGILVSRIGRYKEELPNHEITVIESLFPDIIEAHWS